MFKDGRIGMTYKSDYEKIATAAVVGAVAQIAELESAQTPRMLSGAALGNADDVARLAEMEAQIAGLREELSHAG